MLKHFEVKTGKNIGFYIVTTNARNLDPEEYKILATKQWGILEWVNNLEFYNKHGISIDYLIWTHQRFAGHEFNRKIYTQLVKELE